MSELRLIDATYQDKNLRLWLDTNNENGVVRIPEFVVEKCIGRPTIDPETLPIVQELREKLARYEQAEQEGRLVELPCKVGVYAWVLIDDGLYETRVHGISVSARGDDVILHFGGYPVKNAWGSEIGKTVFLTRKEAEAALKERENDG